jgi:hypothetical protein
MKKRLLYGFLVLFVCMTGSMRAWALEQDANGVYQIGTEQDLIDFAAVISSGTFDAKAVLTADIALTAVWETPIGTAANGAFTGFFDGQGHKITGFEGTSHGKFGLFGLIKQATVQNFTLAGKLTASNADGSAAHGAGAIGWSESSHISGVHSELQITIAEAEVHHVGGVVGSSQSGGNVIRCCSFSGSLSEEFGNTDCFGGVVGYMGSDSIVNCANYGSVSYFAYNGYVGGILGYLNNGGATILGCLNTGKVTYTGEGEPSYGGAIIGRLRDHNATRHQNSVWLEGSALKGSGENSVPTTISVTAEQLASGEICYLMNTDQTQIGWYQTLGTDAMPVFDATHGQVYMNGHQHCNGDAYEGVIYSNENTGLVKDDHVIVDGFCSYCGLFDETYLQPNADGYYEIANARQLTWFEQKVNTGELTANAILTADIDFADLMPADADPEETQIAWTPIGDWGATRGTSSAGYKGHFDGQGHTIKHLNASSKQNYFGVFGVISTDCLIENFTVYGTYNISFQYAGGVAAYARDDRPTIRNVHSFVNINNTCAGGRQGGILGGVLTTSYKTTIENCSYFGTLDGNDAGGSGNYGGIVGYVNNNGSTVADITNCLFNGEVVNKNEAPGGCTFGGFVGYSNGGVVTIKNGLSIGKVESAVWGQFFGAVKSTKSSLPNSYYIGEILNGSASTVTLTATETNPDELASGEIAWKLNEEEFLDAVWRQDIGYDDYPQPTSVGAFVYPVQDGGYASVSEDKPESFDAFRDGIIANETAFIEDEELVAYQPLVNEYKELIKSWESIDNLDEFLAAYKAGFEVKEAVKKSAASYTAYAQACDAAAAYVKENQMEGEYTEFLVTYLEETLEPNNDYPNGTAPYIMENRNLNDEAITKEIAFVNQMLANALAGGVTPGTEITRLITNPDFTEGEDKFEGWTKEAGEGATFATGGVQEIMNIARGKDGTFDIKQTVSDLQNGIYMMALNGLFLDGGDIYSQFYAGQLYLNNTYNYFMTSSEDVISVADAVDKENCLLSDDDEFKEYEEVVGYVPSTFKGCSYAYNAGRYPNFCATEVTDGTLTIGMRNLGAAGKADWMPFGNLRVYYLGNAEEANDKLADVLAGFVARAQVIVDFEISDGYEDVEKKPNISAELKGLLIEAISAADEAATGEQKMALINTFSGLFNEVHACRKAYIAMAKATQTLSDAINDLLGLGLITDEEYSQWDAEIYDALDHFVNGTVSTEEALAIAKKMNIMDEMLPQVDGIYQVTTPLQMQLLSVVVNNGETNAKAVLVNDIDMSEVVGFIPIGDKSNPFSGEFDGQGFKISNFGVYNEETGEYSCEMTGFGQGLFGFIKNATVQNFSIDGHIVYYGGDSDGGCGVIGRSEGSVIRNIHSALIMDVPSTSHHFAGVCGDFRESSKAYNCSFSGAINETAGSHDCIGGIGGYSNTGVSYTNCANYGTITYVNASAYAGGICGYVNNDSFTGVFNCLNVGNIQMAGGTPTYGGAFIGRLRSHANSQFVNNYWLQGSAPNASGENGITANVVNEEQLASGEVCFKLNAEQEVPAWYQNLAGDDKDAYPVLDPTHKVVLYDEVTGYYNEGDEDPDGISTIEHSTLNIEHSIYNLAGQRMSKLQKGINIVGGKKVAVK